MSDVEEGEIEGELAEAPPPPPPQQPSPEHQQEQQAALPAGPPKERVLAPAPNGRAPYYADPSDNNGFKGRGPGGKKKRKKAAAAAGFVDVYGQGASAAVELYREQGPIRLIDAQNLILWVLADGINPRWCFVKHKPLVKKVLLLAAHGLDADAWAAACTAGQLPAWRALLGEPIELQARTALLAPGATAHALLTVPETRKRRREDGELAQQAQQAQQEDTQAKAVPPAVAAAAAGAEAAGETDGGATAAHGGGAAGHAAAAAPGKSGPAAAHIDLLDAAHGSIHPVEAATTDLGAPCDSPLPQQQVAAAEAPVGDEEAPATAPPAKRRKLGAANGAVPAPDASLGADSVAETAATAMEGTSPAEEAAPDAAERSENINGNSAAAAPRAANGGSGPRRRPPCTLPPSHYILTLDQLQEHGYPLPVWDEAKGQMVCPEGFVATKSSKGQPPAHDLVALDCEMCITAAGFELTRATLIDRQGQVLMDELVVPTNPITDHNTRYSGITPEMLDGVTTRLPDVQARFRELVAAETLVVAHAGENDLQALKIIHANVIDTSVLFPHPRGPPYKSALRILASRHLSRTIQQGSHDPVEDARAALDLALLKFERGPAYGAHLAERGERLVEALGTAGRRSVLVDRLEFLNRQVAGDCAAVVAEGDAEAVAALQKELPKQQAHFLWGQLWALQRWFDVRLAAVREAGRSEPSEPYRIKAPAVSQEEADTQPGGQQNGAAAPQEAAEQQQQDGEQQQQQLVLVQQDGVAAADGGSLASQRHQNGAAGAEDVQQLSSPGTALDGQIDPQHEQLQEDGLQSARQQQDVDQSSQLQGYEEALASLDASLAALWQAAPPGTLVLVVTGQGDTSYTRYLQEQKWRRQQGLDGQPSWTPGCEAHMAAWQARVQTALCFAAVKPAGGGGSPAD